MLDFSCLFISDRKPVLQRRASTCCSARCGGGGTAPSAGGHTRCGRAGRPRRTTAWAAAGIGGHLRGIVPPASRRNEGPSSRPRQPSASVSPRDRRVVRGLGLLKLLPRRGAFAHAAMMRPPARHALRHRHTRKAEQSAPPHLSQTGWGKRGSEDSLGRMNHSRWRRRAHPNQQWVQA